MVAWRSWMWNLFSPDYTMYLPVDDLLTDLRAGIDGQAQG